MFGARRRPVLSAIIKPARLFLISLKDGRSEESFDPTSHAGFLTQNQAADHAGDVIPAQYPCQDDRQSRSRPARMHCPSGSAGGVPEASFGGDSGRRKTTP